MNDSLIQVGQNISKLSDIDNSFNWWMYIAIAEVIIILFLILILLSKQKNTAKQKFREETLKQDIDFGNIINSSFNATKLYDQLKIKCHPDLFPTDNEKNRIAENIFQEVTKNKTNIKKLQELKEEAISKLNINFKNKM